MATPDVRSTDPRILQLLDAAHERLTAIHGLGATPVHHAERLFRDVVMSSRHVHEPDQEDEENSDSDSSGITDTA